MVIKIYTLKMHQAQHSISWYPQYSNDQHTISPWQHCLEAHQGSWNRDYKHQISSQPDLQATESQEESILRKSADPTNLAPVFESPVPPQRAGLHFHTQKQSRNTGAGNSSSMTEITPFPALTTHLWNISLLPYPTNILLATSDLSFPLHRKGVPA